MSGRPRSPEAGCGTDSEMEARVAPNLVNTLAIPPKFIIDLHINPEAPQAQDDVYSLLHEDGSVHQQRRVSDDAVKGDDRLTLVFTGLHLGLKYSLEIDEGAEGKYFAFHNVLLKDLIALDSNPEQVEDGAGAQPLPADYESLALEAELPEIPEERLLTSADSPDYTPPGEEIPAAGKEDEAVV